MKAVQQTISGVNNIEKSMMVILTAVAVIKACPSNKANSMNKHNKSMQIILEVEQS